MHFTRHSIAYPLKVRRLEQLDELGLNVADFVCFAPGELRIRSLRSFCGRFDAVSCRTFALDEDKDFRTPVRYEISDFEEVVAFARENNRKYFVLVNEAVPLRDSQYAGNIWFDSKNEYIVEYFEGPGTPRDLERMALIKRRPGDSERTLPPNWEPQLLQLVGIFPYRPVIFEFSVYPYPVGRRKQPIIFWEWRKV